MAQTFWQTIKVNWFKVILLVASAVGVALGLIWCFLMQLDLDGILLQWIMISGTSVTTSPPFELGIPKRMPTAISLWLLATTVLTALLWLWIRRQFSLRVLMIAVFVAATLAMLPLSTKVHTPERGRITIAETLAQGSYSLSETEIKTIEISVRPEQIFAALPDALVKDLKLTGTEIISVDLSTTVVTTERELEFDIHFSRELSAVQTATLFECIGDTIFQQVVELYQSNAATKPVIGGGAGVGDGNTQSVWNNYAQAWSEKRKAAAPPAK